MCCCVEQCICSVVSVSLYICSVVSVLLCRVIHYNLLVYRNVLYCVAAVCCSVISVLQFVVVWSIIIILPLLLSSLPFRRRIYHPEIEQDLQDFVRSKPHTTSTVRSVSNNLSDSVKCDLKRIRVKRRNRENFWRNRVWWRGILDLNAVA